MSKFRTQKNHSLPDLEKLCAGVRPSLGQLSDAETAKRGGIQNALLIVTGFPPMRAGKRSTPSLLLRPLAVVFLLLPLVGCGRLFDLFRDRHRNNAEAYTGITKYYFAIDRNARCAGTTLFNGWHSFIEIDPDGGIVYRDCDTPGRSLAEADLDRIPNESIKILGYGKRIYDEMDPYPAPGTIGTVAWCQNTPIPGQQPTHHYVVTESPATGNRTGLVLRLPPGSETAEVIQSTVVETVVDTVTNAVFQGPDYLLGVTGFVLAVRGYFEGSAPGNEVDPGGNMLSCRGLLPTRQEGGGAVGTVALGSPTGGARHSCVIRASDARSGVRCWGDEDRGQTGHGSFGGLPHLVPEDIPELTDQVTQVSAGSVHTCAIRNGAVYCWGDNTVGQSGQLMANGVYPVPTLVSQLASGVGMIDGGEMHTCAIKEGGAFCWGENMFGQLGNGEGGGMLGEPNPQPVMFLNEGVHHITAGGRHSCALKNGVAYCWGDNSSGQLGDGTNTTSFFPVQVDTTDRFVFLSAGSNSTCGLAENGDVLCWGGGTTSASWETILSHRRVFRPESKASAPRAFHISWWREAYRPAPLAVRRQVFFAGVVTAPVSSVRA